MISEATARLVVFVYLPGELDAVPAGELRLTQFGNDISSVFVYGTRYVQRPNALEIDPVSLGFRAVPRRAGEEITPAHGLSLFGGIRDAAPDAWGRRVIERRLNAAGAELSEAAYLLETRDDRTGALDFRKRRTDGPRKHPFNRIVQLDYLLDCADRIDNDEPVPAEMLQLFQYGSSMGGARPKSVVEDDDGLWVAKFPARRDRFNEPVAEAATLALARDCGVEVPLTKVVRAGGRDVLLVKRFDREKAGGNGYYRRHFNSALTLLGKDETESLGTAYSEIVAAIARFAPADKARAMKQQLFRRMVFNILVSNTDDHLRNFGFLASGRYFELSPAYDIMPTPAVGFDRYQHLAVGRRGRLSTLDNALTECGVFALTVPEATAIINGQLKIVEQWRERFEAYGVSATDIDRVASAFRAPQRLEWGEKGS